MPSYRASFRTGLLLGLGATFLYAAARRGRRSAPASLIGWDWATRVATRVSGADGRLTAHEQDRLQPYYADMVADLEGPIAAYTGTQLAQSTRVQVMDRPAWVRANVANFRELFQPIDELYQEVTHGSPLGLPGLAQASQALLSVQVGTLLGYLARKVLGQYDMSLLGKEPLDGGQLYFVEPNIRALETMLDVPPDELRRWIALHEATHAHEFEVYPWVRGYMNEHLQHYLRSMVADMRRSRDVSMLTTMLGRLIENLRSGRSLLESMMTPEQRGIVSRLQALMSLAEGYSNHVMNAVGKDLLPHFHLIHDRVEARQRQRGKAEELFLRLTGLKMKLDQYRLGEAFTDHVVRARGVALLNRAWEAPEHLPTEAEIKDPNRWIARMDGLAALRAAS